MKALTLWPEWAWAILHLGKDVENRCWALPTAMEGQWLALHAGKSIGGRPGFVARDDGLLGVRIMSERANVPRGRFKLQDVDECPKSAIVALVRFGETTKSTSPWAVPGQLQWPILEVRPLPRPVPCKGAQGLWVVPDDVAKLVNELWKRQDEAEDNALPTEPPGFEPRPIPCPSVDASGLMAGCGRIR